MHLASLILRITKGKRAHFSPAKMCLSLGEIAVSPIRSNLCPLRRHFSLCSKSPKLLSITPSSIVISRCTRKTRLIPAAATASDSVADPTEKLGVVVNVREGKPRIVLKFVWMEKNIGLGLDQVVPGYGTIPLSPYYFWPQKEAWEQLKRLLEGKPWISEKRMMVLLNQATDIINLWQQNESANL